MKNRTQDMLKVDKVIKSCETVEHCEVTSQLISNFFKKYDKPAGDMFFDDELYLMTLRLRDALKEHRIKNSISSN